MGHINHENIAFPTLLNIFDHLLKFHTFPIIMQSTLYKLFYSELFIT